MGTHPIFESDFDCLTEYENMNPQDAQQKEVYQIKNELNKNIQILRESLRQVKNLRSTVDQVFTFLNKGFVDDYSCADANKNQQKFLQSLQNSLKKVNSDYGELEKTCEKLPSMGIVPMVPALGNNGQLSLDSSIEKVQLNQQIQRGHVWWEHLQDHIAVSHSLLARNMLKRTSYPHSHPQNKIQRPPSKSHYPPNDNINFIFLNMQKTYQQDLKFQLHQLYGHSRVMQVVVGKVMFVHIVLRGLNIERVFVRGLDEEDQMVGLDLFTESQYQVMRMVTDHATAASLHYFHSNIFAQNSFDTVLRTFLHWLRSFRNLFSEPCKRCGKFLMEGLPPTWRDYTHGFPYHYQCKN